MIVDNYIEKNIGRHCTVILKDTRTLFLATLLHYDQEKKIIRVGEYKKRGELWTFVTSGMEIKISVKSNEADMQMLLLEGAVIQCAKEYLLMEVYHISVKKEEREYFRQNIYRDASIALVNGKKAQHDCVIADISITGIGIQSDIIYQVGDFLYIHNQRFMEKGADHNLKCQVVRKSQISDGKFLYGCRFVNISKAEQDKLFSEILALQAEHIRRKRKM